MSKFDDRYSEDQSGNSRKPKIHPVWRGIGIIFLILGPVIAYFSALLLIQENYRQQWYRIPADLIAKGADPYLYVKIILMILILLIIYIIFSFVTFVLYRIFAPPRYGPTDIKPGKYRGKRYKR
jgi:hypothetical protein